MGAIKCWLPAFLIPLFLLPACAQTRPGIRNGYAYFKPHLPGNIMADDAGNPVQPGLQVTRFIYLEADSSFRPVVESVGYNGQDYPAAAFPVTEAVVNIGIKKTDNRPVVLRPGKGSRIWRVELTGAGPAPSGQSLTGIQLKGTNGGKAFTFPLKKEEELLPDLTY